MIKCKVCDKELKSLVALGQHIKQHKLTSQQYYDKYLKQEENEGICPICGKPTRSLGFNGYKKYCSNKCASNSKEVKEKIKQTNLKKYGTENVAQVPEIKDKIRNTVKSEECQTKIKQTNLEKYGTEWPNQNEEIKKIGVETNIAKYGKDYAVQNTKKTWESRKKYIEDFEKENDCIEKYKLVDKYGQGWLCLKLNQLEYKGIKFIPNTEVPKIEEYSKSIGNASHKEKEVVEFIKSIYNGIIIENTKKIISPYELDIYLPDKNLAIEFNGTYFHSTNAGTLKNYHLNKTELCEKNNIRLIHIFEWEWDNKKDICKSIIASALGIYQVKIYARNCEIKEVDSYIAKEFLENNHIQGSINSSYRLGLFYNNELVQLICIGKSRFKKDEYELLRMCTKLNTQVIGGFSKLITHQPYNNLISFIDRSKFTGNSYSINFKEISKTPISYVYIKGNRVLNRISAQKHKLKTLLGENNFNENKTEQQNMLDNGWQQVYDCGNIKVQYIKKEVII